MRKERSSVRHLTISAGDKRESNLDFSGRGGKKKRTAAQPFRLGRGRPGGGELRLGEILGGERKKKKTQSLRKEEKLKSPLALESRGSQKEVK